MDPGCGEHRPVRVSGASVRDLVVERRPLLEQRSELLFVASEGTIAAGDARPGFVSRRVEPQGEGVLCECGARCARRQRAAAELDDREAPPPEQLRGGLRFELAELQARRAP